MLCEVTISSSLSGKGNFWAPCDDIAFLSHGAASASWVGFVSELLRMFLCSKVHVRPHAA